MKIRNGFVSNSSSSSFIVGIKDKQSTKIKIEIEINLKNYGKVFTSESALREYFVDDLCRENLDIDKYYVKAKQIIACGGAVVAGMFSSESDSLEAMLCDMGLKKVTNKSEIEIIQNEGGY